MEEKKLYCMTQGAVNGRVDIRQRHVKRLEDMERRGVILSAFTWVCGVVLGFLVAYMWF